MIKAEEEGTPQAPRGPECYGILLLVSGFSKQQRTDVLQRPGLWGSSGSAGLTIELMLAEALRHYEKVYDRGESQLRAQHLKACVAHIPTHQGTVKGGSRGK